MVLLECMGRKKSTKKCPVCHKTGVKRNGVTSSGRIRWRCTQCGASTIQYRLDITHKAVLTKFLDYLMGKQSQSQINPIITDRSFRTRIAWCWNIRPCIPVTREKYDVVQIDGTYLPYDWCLLTALAHGKVVAYQWCHAENKSAYHALLSRLVPPVMVVTDGHTAALQAIHQCWPSTRVQRCLVHVKRNIRALTSTHPKHAASKALWGLAQQLVTIHTLDQSIHWLTLLQDFYDQYGSWINEKTWRDSTLPGLVPSWVRHSQQWWWTHYNSRRAYRLLEKLARQGVLFTFLDPCLREQVCEVLPSTTNALEGGVNAQIKNLIRCHRGLSEEHMRRAVEWWCYLHSSCPVDPVSFISRQDTTSGRKQDIHEEEIGPVNIDTAIDIMRVDYSPGISIRKGHIK